MATRVSSLPTATPFVRLLLALGEPPTGRVHGWVTANITGGADNVPPEQLWARYGPALAAECLPAGFTPAYLTGLDQQSPEARAAALTWASRVRAEGVY
jgi:hypothetical protein